MQTLRIKKMNQEKEAFWIIALHSCESPVPVWSSVVYSGLATGDFAWGPTSKGLDMQRTGLHRMIIVITVICSYLCLTGGLFYWHFTQELAAGSVPEEMRFYEGSVKNGDFWYRVRRATGDPLSPKIVTRLARLNLETGVESETEFEFDEDYVLPVWLGEMLYVFTRTGIYQITGNSISKLEPAPFPVCLSPPFLYNGRITVIYDASALHEGSHEHVQLAQWQDGEWINGRRILLPGWRFWVDDPQRGTKVLNPRTSEITDTRVSSPTSYYFTYGLIVAQHEQRVHVMLARLGAYCSGYRDGFEFGDEHSDVPSALAPENAPHEVSGWKPILADGADDDWVQMACDDDGLLFVSTNKPQRIVRRHFDGRSEELTGDKSVLPQEVTPWIAVDSLAKSTYLIRSNPFWGSASIRRIEGNVLRPPHLVVPGFERDYIARWQRVGWRLLSVWLVPIIVLVSLQQWLTVRQVIAPDIAAGPPMLLASSWQRASSFLIDLILCVVLSWLLWRFYLWSSGVVRQSLNPPSLADMLTNIEWSIRTGNVLEFWQCLRESSIGWLTIPFDMSSAFFAIFYASVLPVFVAKVCVEGRTGLTPGNYLLGIRTVRTTLRSCGVARTLLRDLAYYIDAPFLLSPLPAVVSMLLSDYNQRIGDRLADTIVVDASAMRFRSSRDAG